MPSQKQSKRVRHEPSMPRPVLATTRRRVPPAPAARRASPRVLLVVGGTIVAAVAAAVLALSVSGGSTGSAGLPTVGTPQSALPGAKDTGQLFKGIPQEGNDLGSPDAPVTLVEYADLQCPYCREFEASVLPSLVRTYVRSGRVRIELRLLDFIGPDSASGRDAPLAAGRQNKLFDYATLLYFNQGPENTGWLDQEMVNQTAASIPGLQVPLLLRDAKSAAIDVKAKTLDAQAKTDGVGSTPTILVGQTGAKLQEVKLGSPTDLAVLETAIGAARAG